MARLRDVCVAAGGENVRTYIASGNVVLDSRLTAATFRKRLENEFQREFGFHVVILVLTASELRDAISRNPFSDADPKTLHLAFAFDDLDRTAVDKLEAKGPATDEEAKVVGRQIYFRLPRGFGQATLPGRALSKMQPPVTIRSWRTILTLDKMAGEGA